MTVLAVYVLPLGVFDSSPDNITLWFKERRKQFLEELMEKGKIPPAVLFLAPDPQNPKDTIQGVVPFREYTSSEQKKELFSQMATSLLVEVKAFACITVFESWFKEMDPEELDTLSGSLAEDPSRQEALIVVEETTSSALLRTFMMIREGEKLARLEEKKEQQESEGRFVSLLGRARDHLN